MTTTTIADETTDVRCECGEATGEPCAWSGPIEQTVLVEWMPEDLRASHEAAGNWGAYPANGAVRLRVEAECGDRLRCTGDDYDDCQAADCVVHSDDATDDPPHARLVG